MNQDNPSQVQTTGSAAGAGAALVCFASSSYVFLIGAPTVDWLNTWWAAWLVYLAAPLALTFTFLHASRVHRELSEAVRDVFLLFVSLAIFIGMVFFAVAVVVVASVFMGFARIGP